MREALKKLKRHFVSLPGEKGNAGSSRQFALVSKLFAKSEARGFER